MTIFISRQHYGIKRHALAVNHQEPPYELAAHARENFESFCGLHRSYHANQGPEHTQRAASGFLNALLGWKHAGVAGRLTMWM